MAIARKPVRPAAAAVNVETLIRRGGSPSGDNGDARPKDHGAKGATPVILRIPHGMLRDLDAAVNARGTRTTRTTWLLEAITEKLERER
jgi:hypothetical protein